MKLINIVSLGCSKNLVDSETILGILSSGGYVVTPSLEDAEIILINTCGFIEPAVKEAVDTIFNCLQFKEKGCCKYVIVLGCLVSRYGEKRLSQLFPEVDGWLGVDAYTVVLQYLDRLIAGEKTQFMESRPCGEYLYPRMLSTPSHTAYLKIAEGCSHACSFCLIPRIRGPLYSKTPDVIYREAEQLASGGVKELILVAQDSGAYGRDLPGKPTLTELLKNLVKIKDLHWIRFLYMNPYSLTPDLIKTMQEEKKLCNYLDLPLQHVNRNILKSMGRRGDVYSYRKLIKEVKTALPDLVLRTTLMVGYPGEDREAFQELQAFVGHGYFDRLGVFPYYHEEEARSFRYQDTVSFLEKHRRARKMMQLQRRVSRYKNERLIGMNLEVLIEHNLGEDVWWGRSYRDIPEIDPRVIVKGDNLEIGTFVQVQINRVANYDLIGTISNHDN
jgi:ribosomal protein S12 methylthiotransferase